MLKTPFRSLSSLNSRFFSLKQPSQASYIIKKIPNFTPQQRESILKINEYNVFNFPSQMVCVDFLSDSGTHALTQNIWSSMLLADESYSRNSWYYALLDSVRDFCERETPKKSYKDLFDENYEKYIKDAFSNNYENSNFVNGVKMQNENPNTFILPQGRCCETVLFQALQKYTKDKQMVISNGLFETTQFNAKLAGFDTLDLYQQDLISPFDNKNVGKINPFRGGIDLEKLSGILSKEASKVCLIVMTLTNNMGAGQPVSYSNLIETSKLCKKYNIPLWLDCARIVDNSWFIQKYELTNLSIRQINKKLFELCDGFHFSLKKALCNIGGVMCINKNGLFAKKYPYIGKLMRNMQIISYGHDSYGGMSGRDIAAATIALQEICQNNYLENRIEQVEYLTMGLEKSGIPVALPPGGHAVYIDINRMFKDRKWDDYMGIGLIVELLIKYGIRGTEIGYVALELDKYVEKVGKLPEFELPNLVRLAIPENVYGKEHMDYTIDAFKEINENKHKVKPFKLGKGKDDLGRYFSMGFIPK